MPKFFFYTDPTKIKNQGQSQVYGPIQIGSPSATDETLFDIYQTTNLHTAKTTTTAAPVIAVCDGTICIQSDDKNTYSIILKPAYQPAFDFPYIKYFIYKGVKKDALVTGNAIKDDTTIPLTQKIKDAWDDKDGTNPISESAKVLGIGLNNGSLFSDTHPIDHFFQYPNPDFQLPDVKAGEKMGVFDAAEFGFEIVLERLGYEPLIALARAKVNNIKVKAIDQNQFWEADNAEHFLHWQEKEACLNYIDPCAFYGSFCGSKVFFIKNSKREKSNKPQEIYDDLLSTFLNKNKIYLDIRNDYNYSLNYFKDYGFGVGFVNGDTNASVPFDTTLHLWPINILDISTIAIPGNVHKDFFRTQLSLPKGNNNVPLVYLSKAYVRNFRKLKRKHKVIHPTKPSTGDFLTPFPLAFPTIADGANDLLIANYYRINYYDQDRNNSTTINSLAPSKAHYLNGLFRPLDLKQSIAIRGDKFRYTIWKEEVLVNLIAYGGPAYLASIGIAEDEHHITFFAFPSYFIQKSHNANLPNAFTSFVTQSKEDARTFLQVIFDAFKHKKLSKQELDFQTTTDNIDVVVAEQAPFNFPEDAFRQNENPEDYIFLIFDKNEYQLIINTIENSINLLKGYPTFLTKDSINIEKDEKEVTYLKIILDANGFKQTAAKIEKLTVNINKAIFEYADF